MNFLGFHIDVKILSNIREVHEHVMDNEKTYYVVFKQTKLFTAKYKDTELFAFRRSTNDTSSILFQSSRYADAYAKAVEKCDERGDREAFVYPKGYKKLSKLGVFSIFDRIGETVSDLTAEYGNVHFIPNDTDTYGRCIDFRMRDMLFSSEDEFVEDCINGINISHGDKVISIFDAGTYEYIPVESLKATSEELEELKRLMYEYYERQDAYVKFLQSLRDKKLKFIV